MTALWIAVIGLLSIFLLTVAVGETAARVALRAMPEQRERPPAPEKLAHGSRIVEQNIRRNDADVRAWKAKNPPQEVAVRAEDGLQLRGFVYRSERESGKWVVLIHGYRGSHLEMETIALHYVQRGYNALLPDLRAHGKSQGKWIGMGWSDRLDILRWIDDLLLRYGPSIEIVLHGHSMGASAALMASGETLPTNVRAVVADCGYTDAWEICRERLKKLHLPLCVLGPARVVLRFRGGYDIKNASAVEQVKKSVTPTLFIHGDTDDFVPTRMVYPLYAAAACEKQLLLVEGARHVQSKETDPALYYGTVFSFLEKYV